MRRFTPNKQTCLGAMIPFSRVQQQQQQPVAGRQWGYVAATVYTLGAIILAPLHTGHLTEQRCFQHVHTHHDHRSKSITHPKHRFRSLPMAMWPAFTPIIVLSLFSSFNLSVFLFKDISVLSGSVFAWQ